MKIHSIEIVAFGPFGGSELINFEHLNSAEIFLLSGPTGAGKTSVLDAICFALYGSVPGDRTRSIGADNLASQHRELALTPAVTLEVTIKGARLRIRRSPGHMRPAKRGSDPVHEDQTLEIDRISGGDWTRVDMKYSEGNSFLENYLGMTLDQFSQVVMLPQGRFTTFLRAKASERRELLQKLFATERFEVVENWLKRRAAADRDARNAQRDHVSTRIEYAAGVAGVNFAEHEGGSESPGRPPPDRSDLVLEWIGTTMTDLEGRLTKSAADAKKTVGVSEAAAGKLSEARTLVKLVSARRQAEAALQELNEKAEWRSSDGERLIRARKVAPITSQLQDFEEAREARAVAGVRVEKAESALRQSGLGSIDPRGRAEELRLLTAERSRLEDFETEMLRRRDSREKELADLQAKSHKLTTERDQIQEDLKLGPEEIKTLEAKLAASGAASERLEGRKSTLSTLEDRLKAAEALETLTTDLPGQKANLQDAIDHHQEARERYQEIRADRLEGIAAELAGQLEDGVKCQVCGSKAHPEPCEPGPDAPGKEEENAAGVTVDQAEAARNAAQKKVDKSESRLEILSSQAKGATPESIGVEIETARADTETDKASASQLTDLNERLEGWQGRLREGEGKTKELDSQLAPLEKETEALSREAATELKRERELRGKEPSVGSRKAAVEKQIDALEEAAEAARNATERSNDFEKLEVRLTTSSANAGFDDIKAALGAKLDDSAITTLDEELKEHDSCLAKSKGVLGQEMLAKIDPEAVIELESLTEAAQKAEDEALEANTEREGIQKTLTSFDKETASLPEELEILEPLSERARTSKSLSDLASGHGANAFSMPLSTFVLAARLEDVIEAANHHLNRMSGGRYALLFSDEKEGGERLTGLGIKIDDYWTGEQRETRTLSGGESFFTSLSLALGLAEVVQAESGGYELETLFIDEGFGSLDSDTLDQVMDQIDTLRRNGRTVGLVSHVEELRLRIPAQVQVEKSNAGSTLQVTGV